MIFLQASPFLNRIASAPATGGKASFFGGWFGGLSCNPALIDDVGVLDYIVTFRRRRR